MLQAATRNDDSAPDADTYRSARALQVGDELKRAARRLHDALGRMEDAVAAPRAPAPTQAEYDTELLEENQQMREANDALRAERAKLQEERNALAGQLAKSRSEHGAVSQQVAGLSARLEALIGRLGALLAE